LVNNHSSGRAASEEGIHPFEGPETTIGTRAWGALKQRNTIWCHPFIPYVKF